MLAGEGVGCVCAHLRGALLLAAPCSSLSLAPRLYQKLCFSRKISFSLVGGYVVKARNADSSLLPWVFSAFRSRPKRRMMPVTRNAHSPASRRISEPQQPRLSGGSLRSATPLSSA